MPFSSERFERLCLECFAPLLRVEVVEVLLPYDLFGEIACNRLGNITDVGIKPLGIDFPVPRPRLFGELVEEGVRRLGAFLRKA